MGTQLSAAVMSGCSALPIASPIMTSSVKCTGIPCSRDWQTLRELGSTVASFPKDTRSTVLLCQLQLLPSPNRTSASANRSLHRIVCDTKVPAWSRKVLLMGVSKCTLIHAPPSLKTAERTRGVQDELVPPHTPHESKTFRPPHMPEQSY